MENPYWHDDFKPHLVDRNEIRLLCFEINNIVMTSLGLQGSGMDVSEGEVREHGNTDKLFYALAETELSKRLLKLALLIRTFDDTLDRSDEREAYKEHAAEIERSYGDFGYVSEGKSTITKSIRECANKVIHAEDVRPVYDTDDDRADDNARWGMDGRIELMGSQRGERWSIAINVFSFLDGILELVKFDDSDRSLPQQQA